jgi:siroheme synthase
LARMPTVIFLMGLRGLSRITGELMSHGARAETPAAVIAHATLPDQRTVIGTLATIGPLAARAGLESPATLIVGEVVRVSDALARLPQAAVGDVARSAVLIDA